MLERLPERVRSRPVARAMFSPSATLLAGAGMAAAVLAGAPIVAAVALGAAAWVGRVALAVPRKRRADRVNPGAVREPWRGFVVDALDARRRFEVARQRTRPGPLQDRLGELGRRLDDAIAECWRIARQGDALEAALGQLDPAQAQQELEELGQEPPSPTRDRAEQAVRAELAAAERIRRVAVDAHDRLRVINARLDESVARAVELSVGTVSDTEITGVSDQVESVVGEMESLRQALEETQGTPATSGGGAA
jgi:hypothetical protein